MSGGSLPEAGGGKPFQKMAFTAFAIAFAGLLAFLLAAFPARSPEIWVHLVSGRTLFAHGNFADSWLMDGLLFASYRFFGPSGLVGLKAVLVSVSVGALAWRVSRGTPGWGVLLAFTLSVLALGQYMSLTGLVFSWVFVVGVLLATDAMVEKKGIPRWVALACGLLWLAAMRQVGDRAQDHALTGWLLGTLVLAGGLFDGPPDVRVSRAGLLLLWLVLGGIFSALNPVSGFVWVLPAEWGLGGPGLASFARSPFQPSAWLGARQVPSALAYYPVLVLALGAALLPGPSVPMRWRLPTCVVGLLSIWNANWIPWLAVVAGPCIALRIGAWVRQDDEERKIIPPAWLSPLVALLGLALLVLAWPGWLQGAPHERRSLALHLPPAAEVGAKAESQWREKGILPAESRSVHLRLSSLAAYSWIQPSLQKDLDFLQDDLTDLMSTRQGVESLDRLCREKKCHLVVTEPDTAKMQLLLQTLSDNSDKFSLWLVAGPLVVVGPRSTGYGPPALDWADLAFGPKADLLKDPPGKPWPGPFPLADSFTQARPGAMAAGLASEGREWLLLADIRRRQLAREGSDFAWAVLAGQKLAAAVAPGLPSGASGLAWLLASSPLANISEMNPANGHSPVASALGGWRSSALPFPGDGELRGLLTLALRRGREAVALDPSDGRGWMVLGESCLGLMNSRAELAGASPFGEWRQLRQAQAAFAFQRALLADPRLERAHLFLASLYLNMGLQDLEVFHRRAAWDLMDRAGPPPGMNLAEFKDRQAAQDNELKRSESDLNSRVANWTRDTAGRSALDRARMALDRGLGRTALDELLASDIAAFGAQGMALEVDLLLRLGRADEVLAWLNPAEHEGFLPPDMFHWFRVKAAAAVGNYSEACQEAVYLTQGQSRLALPMAPSMALAIARDGLDRLAGPGNGVSAIWNQLPPNDLDSQLSTMLRRWRLEMNGFAVLGLLSLERGDAVEGQRALRESLALSPVVVPQGSGSALDFPARRLARAVLESLPPSEISGR